MGKRVLSEIISAIILLILIISISIVSAENTNDKSEKICRYDWSCDPGNYQTITCPGCANCPSVPDSDKNSKNFLASSLECTEIPDCCLCNTNLELRNFYQEGNCLISDEKNRIFVEPGKINFQIKIDSSKGDGCSISFSDEPKKINKIMVPPEGLVFHDEEKEVTQPFKIEASCKNNICTKPNRNSNLNSLANIFSMKWLFGEILPSRSDDCDKSVDFCVKQRSNYKKPSEDYLTSETPDLCIDLKMYDVRDIDFQKSEDPYFASAISKIIVPDSENKPVLSWDEMQSLLKNKNDPVLKDLNLKIEFYKDLEVTAKYKCPNPYSSELVSKNEKVNVLVVTYAKGSFMPFMQKNPTKLSGAPTNGIFKEEVKYCPTPLGAISSRISTDTNWYSKGAFSKYLDLKTIIEPTDFEVQQLSNHVMVLESIAGLVPGFSGIDEINQGNIVRGSILLGIDAVFLMSTLKPSAIVGPGATRAEKIINAAASLESKIGITSYSQISKIATTGAITLGTAGQVYRVYTGEKTGIEAEDVMLVVMIGSKIRIIKALEKKPTCINKVCYVENQAIKRITATSLESQENYLLKNLQMFSNDPEKNKKAIEIILKKFREMSQSDNARIVFGGSRVRGTAKVSSDLDIGFVGFKEEQIRTFKNYVNKNLNKLYGTSNIQYMEHTWIMPGHKGPGIPKIDSPEEFFSRCGVRLDGEEFTPSGYISVSKEGIIHQE